MTKPITYSKEFFKKKFTGNTMKEAYMNACKWYATNVLSKDELHEVQVEFVKEPDNQFPSVTIHLFAVLDEIKLRERHCAICRELSKTFFLHTNDNCNRCEANAYQKRTDEMLRVKIEYYKELINKRIREDS